MRYCLVEETAGVPDGAEVKGTKDRPLVVRADGTIEEVPE